MFKFCLFFFFFSAVLQAILAADSPCLAGQISIGAKCVDCPPGTYRQLRGMNVCRPCSRGRYNPLSGIGSSTLCRRCPAGTFASKLGSSACLPCPKGTVSNAGATRCVACGSGSYLLFNRCRECDAGTYTSRSDTVEFCDKCPTGSSPEGAKSVAECKPCPRGTRPTVGGCSPCGRGAFTLGDVCMSCPPGSFSAFKATECTLCPQGKITNRIFQENCRPCPPGFTTNGPGASQCKPIGVSKCPKGSFKKRNGDCETCMEGYFRDLKTRTCKKCPPGSVSKGGLRTKCDRCPPGQTTMLFDGLNCFCPQGLFRSKKGTCEKCPPGTGGNFANVPGKSGCIECEPGTFTDKPGSTKCKPCPVGTISGERARKCTPCPQGTTSRPTEDPGLSGGAECINLRSGCPLGTSRVSSTGVRGGPGCKRVPCQLDTPREDIGITCSPCRPGEYLKNGKCVSCRDDEVSAGGIITACTKCQNGLVRSFFDPSKCACDGDGGAGKGIQGGVCKECPPGMFSTENFSECRPCPPGSFARRTGNTRCRLCPADTFAGTSGSAACQKCSEGSVPTRRTGAKSCVST